MLELYHTFNALLCDRLGLFPPQLAGLNKPQCNKPASSSRDQTQWHIAGRARCRHLDAADFKAGHAYSERSEGSIAFPFRILLFFVRDTCFRGWQHDSIPGQRRRLARLLGSSSIMRSFDRVALTATQFRSEGIQNIAGAF